MPVLPHNDQMMLLMAILPMMLIGSILVGTSLDGRGLLGPDRRVCVTVPLSVTAAGISLAAAAIHFSFIGPQLAQDRLLGLLSFAAGWTLAVWALVYVHSRSATVALAGIVVNGFALGISLLSHTVGGRTVGPPDLFAASFELALILLLLPVIAPSLAARLAERQMRFQRAFVLTTFCVSVVTVFTSLALFS